jgi:hypothetical protein
MKIKNKLQNLIKIYINKNSYLYFLYNKIRFNFNNILSLPLLFTFFIFYSITGIRYSKSNILLINSFCVSSGYSNDFLSYLISLFSTKKKIDLSKFDDNLKIKDNIEDIIKSLNNNGYYVFNNFLPSLIINDLVNFALSNSCEIRNTDESVSLGSAECLYSSNKKYSTIYDFKKIDLLNLNSVQNIISYPLFIEIARKYFNTEPYLDGLSMWWTTNYKKSPDKASAQYFHFDMDTIRWLKFFIYLTDVDENSGPHVYISGTHKSGSIPKHILNKGYQRLDDNLIFENFDPNTVKTFFGKKGTIIVEDTRGLHKGLNVKSNDRLLLQLQFSNSLFGSSDLMNLKINDTGVNNLNYLINSKSKILKVFA